MADWIQNLTRVTSADVTLVPASSGGSSKEAFWTSSLAQPGDPYFDVTIDLGATPRKASPQKKRK